MYIMITVFEGDIRIRAWDKDNLIGELDSGAYSDCHFISDLKGFGSDPEYWPEENFVLLLKAQIVVPEKVEVVTKFNLP